MRIPTSLSAVDDSPASAPDRINDFYRVQGDKIDLSGITHGDGTFIGKAAYSGEAGEACYTVKDGIVTIGCDADGDGVSDLRIELVGSNAVMTSTDFVL